MSCAQETAPTGGPKDTLPPIALRSNPQNRQTHFSNKTISITFDEFVVLKDATNQVIISPPIFPKPTFSTTGKSVIVDLKNSELQSNTTYNIFFGEAIQDLHEGNIIPDFHYVFSTGESVDSLKLHGTITNAFENTPSEGIFVMLYENANDTIPFDSLPYRVLPKYICRSKKNGSFNFQNLDDGSYKIFSLKDENRNFLYDLPNEMIAFNDSMVTPYYVKENDVSDTLSMQDTIHSEIVSFSDSLSSDLTMPPINLFLFTEVDSTVKLKEVKVIDSLEAHFVFSFGTKNPQFKLITPLLNDLDSTWMIQEWNSTNDTLIAWFPSLISDSLQIEISNDNQVIDTTIIALKQPSKPRKKDKKENEENQVVAPITLPPLKVSANASGSFAFFNTFKLNFSTPLTKYDFDQVVFVAKNDTIKTIPIYYNDKKREVVFDYTFAEQTKYSIMIPKGAFQNLIGLQNDTLRYSFTTDESSKYGTLKLNLTLPETASQFIVQLISEDGKTIIKEKVIKSSNSIEFGYLLPKKVKIKAVFDTNRNGKWDSGNYLHKIQPERVYLFDKVIDIRAYWDAEENWKIE